MEEYSTELKRIHVSAKKNSEHIRQDAIEKTKTLQNYYGIEPRSFANYREFKTSLWIVLHTGVKAKNAIEQIANKRIKDEKWQRDILNTRSKKLLKKSLDELEVEDDVLKSIMKNNVYSKRDIMKCNLSGALNKLRKQRKISFLIDELKAEVAQYKEVLNNRSNKDYDWKERAIELKTQGMSLRKIAELVGKPKSTLSDFFANHYVSKKKDI